jgi:NAD-dependent dihydropyrimidine dehydrogenase PreA subunit
MISLNWEACNDCPICQAICPNYVFGLIAGPQGKQRIDLTYPDQCCECWQCVAVCPQAALSAEGVRKEDFEQAASVGIPPQTMRSLLLSRRSVRAYKPEAPLEATIQLLLEVATHAGTSSNGQTEGFLVLRAGKFLTELEALAIEALWNAGLKYLDGGLIGKFIEKILTKKYGLEMSRQ